MRKPVYRYGITCGIGSGDEIFIAAIVFEQWSNVESFRAMGCISAALGGGFL